ncbi:hypothetical protein nbrc107696_00610 [Gordonia spumicola]|uniref:Mammalian cell entry protein n=1 Tax=Gordonia spumicola TaxID=589161 RepID=A0A7I9V2H5_9ACTN|nr:hypothetical protein [Gordonia spumicola]GED99614.1 hypothetical protein nbrc107696_00610 [Gordonia spumicola]
MVRTDHEDGPVLNPDSPDDTKKTAAVRKSSPVSRRRKPSSKAAPTPDTGVSADAETDDVADTTEKVDLEKSETVAAVETVDAAEAQTVVAGPQPVSYRARRSSVKAPMGSSSGGVKLLPVLAVVFGALLLIGSIVASSIFLVRSSDINDERALRASYDQFAQEVVIKLTTLDKANADDMYKFMLEHTSGRAKTQFDASMKQARDLIKSDNMKTTTTVVASAVEKAEQDQGSVLVVFVWQGIAPEAPQQPDIQTFRSRISITRINGDLKMTNFEWVN